MYLNIKNAIKDKVSGIESIGPVYGYEKGELGGYPAAVVVLEAIESEIHSTTENERKYTFKVRVYQEMTDDAAGAEEAEGRIEAISDALLSAFDDDYTLGGLCHRVSVKGLTAYVDRVVSTRVFEMNLDCYTIYSLS